MGKIRIEISEYIPENGIQLKWEDGFDIVTQIVNGVIKITANTEGLISLANHLLNLSQEKIPRGHHLHFDEYNALDKGSIELIIEKK
jgi:hypothetical protein